MNSTYAMDGWILLVILYIIFMAITSLVKKSKLQSTQPRQQKGTAPKDLQTKFEEYFDKIEDYFSGKKPPELPSRPPQESKILAIPKQPQRLELYPPEAGVESEVSSPQRLVQEEILLPERQLDHPAESVAHKLPSILSFDKRHGYIQGMIMSEILGLPVSKRHRRRRTL